jgi:hypothetical protein
MINAFTDWARLARAVEFYSAKGFLNVELNWHAPLDVCAITCPDEGRMYKFDNEYLVGSAEQSFMSAQLKGMLPETRYVAITPCFRREPILSETHLRTFMKVELFAAHQSSDELAYEFALVAAEFMKGETSQSVEIVKTVEGYDLEIGGIEVGSYAARKARGMEWTCGTGLAEPRFSVAVANADAGIVRRLV